MLAAVARSAVMPGGSAMVTRPGTITRSQEWIEKDDDDAAVGEVVADDVRRHRVDASGCDCGRERRQFDR